MNVNKNRYPEVKSFIERNACIKNNKIVTSFLQEAENQEILNNYLKYPTTYNKNLVDRAYRLHHAKIRIIAYLSSLIRFSTIDLMRRYRKHKQRFIISQPIENVHHSYLLNVEENLNLSQSISNYAVYKKYKTLTVKQKKVLNLKYCNNMNITEIAELFNESSQNISKIHKTGIKKLQSAIGDIS
jgi:RNA polymerase sigma factor (sigma-70 family)